MAQTRQKKKPTCIDLFCGCGGLSKGFELAGFKIVGGIDFNAAAIKTFNRNFKDGKGICCDILNVDKKFILNEFDNLKNIDVIIGGPPCQGFSSANRYNRECDDPRNKLFFEFIKFVDIAKPKAIVIENVRGIITKNNGYAKDRITEIFEERGYKVTHQILDASEYGVPQKRLRNFFVMTKNSPFSFASLKKIEKPITVSDAISDLYSYEKNQKYTEPTSPNVYLAYLRKGSTGLVNHDIRYPAEIVQKRISFVKQGRNWQDVPKELWPTQRNNRHSSAYKRLSDDMPSVTIDTGNNHSNYFHPRYNRIPTVREAARLQSFPDVFEFVGNRSEQYRQVGNAVPPLLAKVVAEEIIRSHLK
ncbi:MAG: DNA cytosine methyltransferase [Fibrobacter sp.]|nr:DNA cytosine methyltransferase [Fibrobacter sp.]